MGKTFKERLERLDDIKATLISDRNFYMSRKDWAKVYDLRYRLKLHDEQMAKVIRLCDRLNEIA